MTNLTLSIIIPMYNAENTIEMTVQSILNQNYSNFEIIIINDGSTDKSYDICQKIRISENRIRLFNIENNGVAYARNFGVKQAQGKYIIHVDSDDIVSKNGYSSLIKVAESTNADLIIAPYFVGKDENFDIIRPKLDNLTDECLKLSILSGHTHAGLWNKLIKKEMYEGLSFDDSISFMEDFLFLVNLLIVKKPTIALSSEPVYYYYQREQSLSNRSFDKNYASLKYVIKALEDMMAESYCNYIKELKVKAKLSYLLNSKNSLLDYSDIYPEIDSYIPYSKLSMKYKVLLLLGLINFKFPLELYKFLKEKRKRL